MQGSASSNSLTITNPLTLYRTLLALNKIRSDPAQHRLAIHLQKLYDRLKDYDPVVKYGQRHTQLSDVIDESSRNGGNVAGRSTNSRGSLFSLLRRRDHDQSLALIQVLTDHEAALRLDSPRGLMLHGEVGTGKSMLIDLFAECLPNRKKRRWHFSNFMLNIFAKMEQLRRAGSVPTTKGLSGSVQDDYPLLLIAKDIIRTSPILFLDEFQLPDRSTSKILSNLLASFFHLGGVLIATSNRMPDELAKAAGIELGRPPSRLESLSWRMGMKERPGRSESMFAGQGEFSAFLELLKARCEIWEMEGRTDYRRHDSEVRKKRVADSGSIDLATFHRSTAPLNGELEQPLDEIKVQQQALEQGHTAEDIQVSFPAHYLVTPKTGSHTIIEEWSHGLRVAQLTAAKLPIQFAGEIPWQTMSLKVYGRTLHIPRHLSKVSCWTFEELCGKELGPADYISIASTFNTIVLLDIPVLNSHRKNEARRFITLLDALYEARCKLLVTAAAGPDDLFFPEARSNGDFREEAQTDRSGDSILPETFSEAYQDATAPFRPNVSSYDAPRSRDLLAGDALEDDPPNRMHQLASVEGGSPGFQHPDFSNVSAFIGDDERFALKRARSRLWEMCGARWWQREGDEWWKPIPKEERIWETSSQDHVAHQDRSGEEEEFTQPETVAKTDDRLEGVSPFRRTTEPPPKIDWAHIWGTVRWGKRAGAWGQGPEGLNQRKKSDES